MPIDWNSLLQKPDVLPLLLCLGIGGLIAITAIVTVQWRKAQQAKYDAYLKERLIERGFTAEEIVTVVQARAAGVRRRDATRRDACRERATS